MSTLARPAKLALSLAAIAALAGAWHLLPQRDAVLRQLWGLNESSYQEFALKLKARKAAKMDDRFSMTLGDVVPPAPSAAPAGGRHGGPLQVTLSAPEGRRGPMPVFYTLDGAVPTRRDRRYEGPIAIDSSTVLRFRSLPEDMLPGDVVTEAYLLPPHDSLPVLSLATDPINLWNKYSGIYENPLSTGRSWERQADAHWMAPGRPPLFLGGELRIHGGYSRRVPKKSFRFRYRVPEGLDPGTAGLLGLRGAAGENTVVIRAGGNAQESRARDALSGLLYARIGGVTSPSQPAAVRLNGTFWGVYDLRERIDVDFLRRRFGAGDYELIAFDSREKTKWGSPVVGRRVHWEKTQAFFRDHSLQDSAAFAAASGWLDVDGTFDYWIHNVFAANVDWPYNNFNAWRKAGAAAGADTAWRWISWDADGTLDDAGKGLAHNTLEWSLRDRVRNDLKWNYEPGAYEDQPMYIKSTLFMRRLLEYPPARERFVRRALDLLNTAYRSGTTRPLLDSLLAVFAVDRARDFERWGWSDSAYRVDMGRVAAFLERRPDIVRGHLSRYFGLGESVGVTLGRTGPGAVRLNSLSLTDSAWTGSYLAGLTVELEALPGPGAEFAGWEGLSPDSSRVPRLQVKLAGSREFRANFRARPGPVSAR
jgi:hypothetical protein